MVRIAFPTLLAAAIALTAPAAFAAQKQAPAQPAASKSAKAGAKAKADAMIEAKTDAKGKQAAADTLAVAEPAKPIAKMVDYAALEQHVGDTVIVETTLDTIRRGKLIKYTNPGLTLQLGPENGSIELDIPRETVRNVSVVDKDAEQAAAAKPEAAKQETGSAKKN
ncbi:MAG: hypothetical protein IT467_02295 [Dokdonella sp.]|uniref:hypothetical protein n=1 Tax=Dokdonella sp. TaxID=2291710 RepID=UPI0025BD32D7|nr:hypothetical protein [Dokdonella sp.]MBZ0222133.1 hypothetical protein [Dokdonella sp.]MCC7254740.1 hypothetical protein [Dokdonella sp.]